MIGDQLPAADAEVEAATDVESLVRGHLARLMADPLLLEAIDPDIRTYLEKQIPRLLELTEYHDAWGAVALALAIEDAAWRGTQGILEWSLHKEHQKRQIQHIEAGRASRQLPPDDQLCDEVLEIHNNAPRVSWTDACEKVAARYTTKKGKKMTGKAVRDRTGKVQWPRPGSSK